MSIRIQKDEEFKKRDANIVNSKKIMVNYTIKKINLKQAEIKQAEIKSHGI